MTQPAPLIEDDEAEAETRALAVAVAESDADPRTVPHEEVRAWLLRLAEGEFDAPPPEPRWSLPVVWRARALAGVSRIVATSLPIIPSPPSGSDVSCCCPATAW